MVEKAIITLNVSLKDTKPEDKQSDIQYLREFSEALENLIIQKFPHSRVNLEFVDKTGQKSLEA